MKTNNPQDPRNRLLGLSTCFPSPKLGEGALFATNEAYLEFLKDSLSAPESHWMKMSDSLAWDTKPGAVGKPGSWFPGGLLNIATICIDKNMENNGPDAPLVWKCDPVSKEVIAVSGLELKRFICNIESFIATWEISPGSPILVALPGGSEMIASLLACLRSGFTVVPIDPTYSKSRIVQRIVKAGCKGVLCTEAVMKALQDSDEIPATIKTKMVQPKKVQHSVAEPVPAKSLDAMHPAFILADSRHHLYTIPAAGFMVQAVSAYKYLLSSSEDKEILWTLAPSHHASTLAALLGALASGCPVGALPISTTDDPESFLDVVKTINAHTLFADVKTVLEAINPVLKKNLRPTLVGPRIFIIEGETLTPRVWKYIQNGLFDGQTHLAQVLSRPESGGFITGPNPRVSPVRMSSVGLPAPGVDLTVIELQEGDCPVGQGGLLALSKPIPGLAIELQRLPTPLSIQVKARRDQPGYLWSMGEAKVARSQTERITLPEIEAAIASIQEVNQVAVIRIHSDTERSRTRAFVQLDGSDEETVRDKIMERLRKSCGEAALPDSIKFVSNLPYSRSGKLLRSVLRRMSTGDPLSQEDLHLISDPQIADEYLQAAKKTRI